MDFLRRTAHRSLFGVRRPFGRLTAAVQDHRHGRPPGCIGRPIAVCLRVPAVAGSGLTSSLGRKARHAHCALSRQFRTSTLRGPASRRDRNAHRGRVVRHVSRHGRTGGCRQAPGAGSSARGVVRGIELPPARHGKRGAGARVSRAVHEDALGGPAPWRADSAAAASAQLTSGLRVRVGGDHRQAVQERVARRGAGLRAGVHLRQRRQRAGLADQVGRQPMVPGQDL